MGETSVRRAAPDDAEGVARVHTAAWQAAYEGVMPDEFLAGLSWERWAEGWRRLLAEPPSDDRVVLVAVQGDEVVGFASSGPARDDDSREQGFFELHAINVRPSAWGTGAGRALLDASLADVTAPGVVLWVLADNPRARRFYEREGFGPDGVTRTETIGGRELLELRYVRPVS